MDAGLLSTMIGKGKDKLYGLEAAQRYKRYTYMREEADRLDITHGSGAPVRKIALVGTSFSARLAPYNDDDWEIWGVGGRMEWVTRASRWFEVHRLASNSEEWVERWRVQAKSWEGKVPIYMHYPEPGFGDVTPYPIDHIMQRFGTHFLTSSFSWMMAMAIDELFPVNADPIPGAIGIYGVDMEHGSEYGQQRPGFHHFIELAKFLGITIVRLASSGIAYKLIPYPMWQDDPLLNKLDQRQIYTRDVLIHLDKTIPKVSAMIGSNMAVIAALEKYAPEGAKDEMETLQAELVDFRNNLKNMEEDRVNLDGADGELQWLREYLTT